MFDALYFYAALIGGTVLAFQFVLMLFGFADHEGALGDGSHGAGSAGGDASHAGGDIHDGGAGHGPGHAGHAGGDAPSQHIGHWFYEMLSLRTISAAMTFFGLTGKAALAQGVRQGPALVIALAAGYGALAGVYWLFKQVFRLQQAGNENVRLAIGAPATVYVPIPGGRAGVGKVMFRLQDRIVEYQAVTEDADRLATGEKVVVEAIVSADTVCVARAPQPAAI
jgi:hypothetical protein